MRFWSSEAIWLHSGRMPGTTTLNASPHFCFTDAISSPEQMIPEHPDCRARNALSKTTSPTLRLEPKSCSCASPMLVSKVTASTSRSESLTSFDASSIASPSVEWIVIYFTPNLAADLKAPRTVAGMSWSFRSVSYTHLTLPTKA